MNNKILITDNIVDTTKLGKDVILKVLSNEDDIIKLISLDILNNSNLEFEYNIEKNIKINFIINIHNNVSCNIMEKKNGNGIKVKYHYSLSENSYLGIYKINDISFGKEYDIVDLKGYGARLNFVLKTICNSDEHYDIIVNHLSEYTDSKLYTNGINKDDGHLIINVTGYVPSGSTNSCVLQDNRIINLTNNKCQINPNLLIDEMIVNASHSAHISDFSEEDLFYIQSRGINKNESFKLLVKGFLLNNLDYDYDEYISSLIKKYWG